MVRTYQENTQYVSIKQAEIAVSKACSFIVSASAANPHGSKVSLLPEIRILTNMEGNGEVGTMTSLSAATSSQNATGSTTSTGSADPDATLKAFRRIHFFTPERYSEILALKKVMAKARRLTQSSSLASIYLLHDPKVPNIVRIDSTTFSPDIRLEQWRSRCSPTLSLVPDTLSREVFYHRRLEELILTDLKSRRIQGTRCQYCNYYHRQEFEISKQLALDTVELWRRWIELGPYDKIGKLKGHWKTQIQGSSSPRTREELYMMLEHG